MWKADGDFELDCCHTVNDKEITPEMLIKNEVDLNCGFATQVPFFFNDQAVKENLFSPLKWKKLSWSKDQRDAYIDRFELHDLIDAQMQELSGGQRQLLNIARMLILEPAIAIIDECFSNMDERMSQKTIALIKTHYPNTIFLFTSHRKADIDFFGAETRTLVKQPYRSGAMFVTLQ